MHNGLLVIIQKWKKYLDQNDACGALLTDLPKVFNCLPHSLLVAKLHAYGFDKTSTDYLKDYLSLRKQKIKTSKPFTNWTNKLHGTLRGSILGPLIFNIFLCDLFLFILNTLFAMGSSELEVMNEIKIAAESFRLWFQNNCMKVNPDKFHLLFSDKKIIRWIFLMRRSQARGVKNFWG